MIQWQTREMPSTLRLICLLTGVGACAGPVAAHDHLMMHVSALTSPELTGRLAGSDGERKALAYVVAELDAAGIGPPPGSERLHRFPLSAPPSPPQAGRTSANAYGYIPGATGLSRQVVVLGAHVDHLGVVGGELHAGAEDNASGVALVLEVSKALWRRKGELGRSIVIAFFGAEEIGKIGSEAYVADPPVPLERTAAMVNVDMIGLPLLDQAAMAIPKALWGIDAQRSVGVIGTEGRPGLRAIVNQGCRAVPITAVGAEDFPDFIRDMINAQALNRGDDAPFRDAGVPAVFFGSGESDTYHSPDDTIDDLDPAILAQRTRAVTETVILLSRADWTFIRQETTSP